MHIWKAWSRVACGAKCSGEPVASCQRTCRKLPFNTASSALRRPRTVLCYLSSHAGSQWEPLISRSMTVTCAHEAEPDIFRRWMVGYPLTVGRFWGF